MIHLLKVHSSVTKKKFYFITNYFQSENLLGYD